MLLIDDEVIIFLVFISTNYLYHDQNIIQFNISDDTVAWMEGDFVSKEVPDVAEEREFIYLG